MNIFGSYSKYYNLLYNEKNYRTEAEFVDTIISKYANAAKTLLDLGCGTGRHDINLVSKYTITGVDRSPEMLTYAKELAEKKTNRKESSKLVFLQGDIRKICLDQQFDCIISLFHVMSYLNSNNDIKDVLKTVKFHLNPKGVFVFDFWYGPAVLTKKPSIRVKRMEDDDTRITRVAEPVIYPNDNIVDVNYTILALDKKTKMTQELKETHRMRYLFLPEIKMLLSEAGFEIYEFGEWLTGGETGLRTWNAYCAVGVGKKTLCTNQ
jgi:SAM-dependent methyltransferase